MVGIVLMGLALFCRVLAIHNLFSIDPDKNIVIIPKLFLPLNWNLTNLPILSPISLVILASIIFILFYLYKTSELMNKKKLLGSLIIVCFLFLIINFLMVQQNRPPAVKFRLAFIPVQSDSTLNESSWMGDALWESTTYQLQSSVSNQAIISPTEWAHVFIDIDSVSNVNYLIKLNSQMKVDYILSGKISGNEKSPDFIYQLIDTRGGKVMINRATSLLPQSLPEISTQIRDEILNHFNIDFKNSQAPKRYVSPAAYKIYLNGKKYYQAKNYQFAIELAHQAIAADSGIVEAYALAGKSYLMKGIEKKNRGDSPVEEFERAKNWLSQAAARDSAVADVFNFLGEYYIYQERWSIAEQMFNKAFRLNPNNPRLYLSLSRLHPSRYKQFGFKNEEQLYRRAIFIDPCYEDGYLMLSDYHLFENQRDKAIQVLEQFLEINPNSVPVLMALGKIYLVRNEILKIIEIYNRVLDLAPGNSDAFYNLGILYYNSKDYDKAEKFLKRAIAIDNHLNSHLYLAYLYEIKGEYDKAIEYLRNRIRYRKGLDDEFAEEARKQLFKLLHGDSTRTDAAIE